jgi:Spy/CpxP family protein refolding chaperone
MKKYLLILFVLCILPLTPTVSADDRGPDPRLIHGLRDKDCVPLMDLDLSEDQRTAILEKERPYREKMMALRIELIGKILEFRRVVRDPGVDEKKILDCSEDIETLKGFIQKESLEYYLGIRRILTPEQIRKVCPPLERRFIRERERRP